MDVYWRAEVSLPCLLNYPNFRYIYLFIYLFICLYIYIYIYIYIFQTVRCARAINAQCANIGPAG